MIPRQYRIHVICILAVIAIIGIPLLTERPAPEVAEKATAAATQFLQLVDAGQYRRSWEEAATPLKEKVSLEEWNARIGLIRTTAGPLVSRQKDDITYTPAAEEEVEEEYVVLEYETVFQAQGKAREILTVVREADNRWRVGGYFIK